VNVSVFLISSDREILLVYYIFYHIWNCGNTVVLSLWMCNPVGSEESSATYQLPACKMSTECKIVVSINDEILCCTFILIRICRVLFLLIFLSSITRKMSLSAAAQQSWVSLGFFHNFYPFSMVFGSHYPVPNTIICQVICHIIQ
jgi:hypothetical protein